MMRNLASYTLKGPMQAILVAAAFAMLSMVMPPLTWVLTFISGGAIALVTLRLGYQKGLLVSAGAVAGSALMVSMAGGKLQQAAEFAILLWLPVWLFSGVLRATRSLATSLQVIAAVYALVVAVVFAVMDDPAQYWHGLLQRIRPGLMKASGITDAETIDQLLHFMASVMTGTTVATVCVVLVISLLVGRGWQAVLYHPGGLRDEFNQMRLGRVAGMVVLVLFAAALVTRNLLLLNMGIVLATVLVFYGLAVVHGLMAGRTSLNFWLVGLYVLLFVMWQIVLPVLIILALTDSWANYRERFRSIS